METANADPHPPFKSIAIAPRLVRFVTAMVAALWLREKFVRTGQAALRGNVSMASVAMGPVWKFLRERRVTSIRIAFPASVAMAFVATRIVFKPAWPATILAMRASVRRCQNSRKIPLALLAARPQRHAMAKAPVEPTSEMNAVSRPIARRAFVRTAFVANPNAMKCA